MVELEAERKRLQRDLDNLEKQINRATGLLGNQNFVARAPEHVVGRERDKLQELESRRKQVAASMAQLRA